MLRRFSQPYILTLIAAIGFLGFYLYFIAEDSERLLTPYLVSINTTESTIVRNESDEGAAPENQSFPLILGATTFFSAPVLKTSFLSGSLQGCPYICNYTDDIR